MIEIGFLEDQNDPLPGLIFNTQAWANARSRLRSARDNNLRWEENLRDFVRWKEAHGHPYVPTKAEGQDRTLGSWVDSQRMAYKAYRRGRANKSKHGVLTADKVRRLKNAGFAFDASHIKKTPKDGSHVVAQAKAEAAANSNEAEESVDINRIEVI